MEHSEVKKIVYIAYELGWIHDRHDGMEPPPKILADFLNNGFGKRMHDTIPMITEVDVIAAETILLELGIMEEGTPSKVHP